MRVLGIAGGLSRADEEEFDLPQRYFSHDAAAVLVEDGVVVAATEQERIDRVKHSNRLPLEAIRFCLEDRGLKLQDVDRVAVYLSEEFLNVVLWGMYVEKRVHLRDREFTAAFEAMESGGSQLDIRKFLRRRLAAEFDFDPGDRLEFVDHHMAHAVSAVEMSGFTDCLTLVLDAEGERDSGLVLDVRGREYKPLATIPQAGSLGHMYMDCIASIGYTLFDEYKVMGLAPYGDPSKLRWFFDMMCALEPEGRHRILRDRVKSLYAVVPPRRSTEPISQVHKDLGASLQEALEKIAFHILAHHSERTKHRNLCLAGGVAHNCTLNGKILASGMFDDVFIQPASHDAGTALGAALHAWRRSRDSVDRPRLTHVYWGTPVGDTEAVRRELSAWNDLLEFEEHADIERRAAGLLASGSVIGWVQGRAEFGPRALGNRSIVADPRPAMHKDLINSMVKKREAYRPFAPSVLEERAEEFFEVRGATKTMPFMTIVTEVRPEKRAVLGAVTHVDGTARVQTVSRKTNERFWNLIHAFAELTDVPVLLNTSFNNNAEPIVDSVHDAITCFLTTGLHYLVVDRFLVRRREVTDSAHLDLAVTLQPHVRISKDSHVTSAGRRETRYLLRARYVAAVAISPKAHRILEACDGTTSIGEMLGACEPAERAAVASEFRELWARRLVRLAPRRSGTSTPSRSAPR